MKFVQTIKTLATFGVCWSVSLGMVFGQYALGGAEPVKDHGSYPGVKEEEPAPALPVSTVGLPQIFNDASCNPGLLGPDVSAYCKETPKFRLFHRLVTSRDQPLAACKSSQEANLEKAFTFVKAAQKNHKEAEKYLERKLQDIDEDIKKLEAHIQAPNSGKGPADNAQLETLKQYRVTAEKEFKERYQQVGTSQVDYESCRTHALASYHEGRRVLSFYQGTQQSFSKNYPVCESTFVEGQRIPLEPTPVSFALPADDFQKKIQSKFDNTLYKTQKAYELYQQCSQGLAAGMQQPIGEIQTGMSTTKKWLVGLAVSATVLTILCVAFKVGPCKKNDDNKSKPQAKPTKKPKKPRKPHSGGGTSGGDPTPTPTPEPTPVEIIDAIGSRPVGTGTKTDHGGASGRPSGSASGTSSGGSASRGNSGSQSNGSLSGSGSRANSGSNANGNTSGSGGRSSDSGTIGGAGGRGSGGSIRPPTGR